MIKNERQFRITRAQADRFTAAIERLGGVKETDDEDLRSLQVSALESQLDDLKAQLSEYEALRTGQVKTLELRSVDQLPTVLIKARIASGMSQKDLADRLKMKEQQIQRYEATDYASASFAKLTQVAEALRLEVVERVQLPPARAPWAKLVSNLEKAGLKQDFILNKLLPSNRRAALRKAIKNRSEPSDTFIAHAVDLIHRVFHVEADAVFGARALTLDPVAAGVGRFKVPATVNEQTLNAYTLYAHYLALLVLDASTDIPQKPASVDASEVSRMLENNYGGLHFRAVLSYVWDLGIPVLPLRDPGAFHGACWRSDYRNIIVLKQRTRSDPRWAFDLLHELRHTPEESDTSSFAVVESTPIGFDRRASLEEEHASDFAGDVLLKGKAEELAEICVAEAGHSVERLKSVVPVVAERFGVSTGVLANYMAFRLTENEINWWGAATNLQDTTEDPWLIARDELLTRVRLDRLSPVDQEILSIALTQQEVDANDGDG